MEIIKKLSSVKFCMTHTILLSVRKDIIKNIGEILQKVPLQTIVFSHRTTMIHRGHLSYDLKRIFIEDGSVIVVADIIRHYPEKKVELEEQFRLDGCDILLIEKILERLSREDNICI